jgi:hypothetical protein
MPARVRSGDRRATTNPAEASLAITEMSELLTSPRRPRRRAPRRRSDRLLIRPSSGTRRTWPARLGAGKSPARHSSRSRRRRLGTPRKAACGVGLSHRPDPDDTDSDRRLGGGFIGAPVSRSNLRPSPCRQKVSLSNPQQIPAKRHLLERLAWRAGRQSAFSPRRRRRTSRLRARKDLGACHGGFGRAASTGRLMPVS